jgi:non-specific serine/threonine protein kinase
LAEVKRLLTTARLVTLIGVGGVGKTRLAARASAELRRRFEDGLAWVELADLREESLLAQTIVDQLAIEEQVDHDALATLSRHFRDRSMLLVLDNAEHVLNETARVVEELLRCAPALRVLVTSRQVLNIPGEHLFQAAPFQVPSPEQAKEPGAGVIYPSLALFQARAESSVSGFAITLENQETIAAICRRLEGIPLAIELVTVKLRALSVEQLAERLDARLETLNPNSRLSNSRHATLQAAIDWSYELCTPRERLLWARASVFAGGFDVDAAEACCSGDGLPASEVLDALSNLVDKSILSRSEAQGRTRFRLLEPLREHGLAVLEESGEGEGQRARHFAWCAELLRQASMQWFGPAQERWCVTLQLEKANIRAAAEYCLARPDLAQDAFHLIGDPWFLWVALFLDEGRHWLDRVLQVSSEPTEARAKALATGSYVAALQGERELAEDLAVTSIEISRDVLGATMLAYATHVRGLNLMFHEPAQSVPILREALALYESADVVLDDYVVGLRIQLGLGLLFSGDVAGASEQFAWCHQLCNVAGERWLMSYVVWGQALVHFEKGAFSDALHLARQALEVKRFFGDALGLALLLELIGWIDAEQGKGEEAATLLGAASRIWDSVGHRLFGSEHWMAPKERATEQCVEQLGRVRFEASFKHGEAMQRDSALAMALNQEHPALASAPVQAVALTPREREIAELVAEGLSNKAISTRLVIAQRTAECHVENILTKFGYTSRSQIAAWVAEHRTAV